jgi:hypothetical protein
MDRKHDAFKDEAPTPPIAEVRSIESWGEKKGLWPLFPAGNRRGNAENLKFEAAKTWCKWAEGQLVTEAEFDKGVADATSQVQR